MPHIPQRRNRRDEIVAIEFGDPAIGIDHLIHEQRRKLRLFLPIVGDPASLLEAYRIGYGAVAINVLMVLVALAVLCVIVVALDRVLTRVNFPGP